MSALRLGSLLRSGASSFALRALNAALAFGLTVLLARSLGPSGYGIYAYAMALVMLLNMPGAGGLPILILRETAAARARERWDLLQGIRRWAFGGALALGVSVAMISILGVWLLGARLDAVERTSVALAVVAVPMIILANLYGATMRGLHHVILGQLPEYVIRPALLFLAIAALLVVAPQAMRPDTAVALHAGAAALALWAAVVLFRRVSPPLPKQAAPHYESRRWLASTLPLTLVSAMHIVHQYTDLIMLGWFRPSDEVGLYRVISQAAMSVSFGLMAVNLVVAPRFSHSHARGDLATLQRTATRAARLVMVLTLPIVAAFLIIAETVIVLVFGEDYSGGGPALILLALGQFGNAAFGSVALLLNMTGHEGDTARGLAVGVVANVALNLALIPPFGINGAAAASALTLVLWNVLLWRAVRHRLGVDTTALGMAASAKG
ncbi:flippase [Arhodomonas sp. SL1]|uniref:flippase n=1 Tax=Arhodomonas sp. SL1 TaxID=3425691 RepID=UPI003F88488C